MKLVVFWLRPAKRWRPNASELEYVIIDSRAASACFWAKPKTPLMLLAHCYVASCGTSSPYFRVRLSPFLTCALHCTQVRVFPFSFGVYFLYLVAPCLHNGK